jgi:predicted GNAT superfamily acetyltransferase
VLSLRTAVAADFNAILALNEESVAALSPLDLERLSRLHARAARHCVVVDDAAVVAFVLALRESADYDSPNFQWFVARYERFLYVDRIVVSRNARGRGAGTLLYRDLFEFAAASSVDLITCEYDLDPPNLRSQRFHAKFGFAEVGRQRVAGGRKQVSLQTARVPLRCFPDEPISE